VGARISLMDDDDASEKLQELKSGCALGTVGNRANSCPQQNNKPREIPNSQFVTS
jgi:hypothetical protein